MPVTLMQLLEARDRRVRRQLEMLASHPGHTLVCITVNIPGSIKRTAESVDIGHEALRATMAALGTLAATDTAAVGDHDTGFEAFLLTAATPNETKRICVGIEESHPLGRLFDIDVIRPDGTPVSREDQQGGMRKCLICDQPARVCMRLRTHTINELLEVINRMHHDFFHPV